MTTGTPVLTARFWRSRRSAAIAGILFGVLLLTAMVMLRLALTVGSLQSLQSDAQRRTLIRWSLNLVPFAGIAFLWFIGVVREQLGDIEDRLFSTVFLGSGLLFLAMLFVGAVTSTSLLEMLAGANVDGDLWEYGRTSTVVLVSVYAMRMAAVFTLSVSTLGLRTSAALGRLPRLRERVDPAARGRHARMDPAGLSRLGSAGERRDSVHASGAPGAVVSAMPRGR